MSRAGLVRLTALAAAVACVLVAFKVLPVFQTGADLGRPPATIVNDSGAVVVVARCMTGCDQVTGQARLEPGQSLRAGAGEWLVEDAQGRLLGCLDAPPGSARLLVSRAGPCPG